MDNGILRIKKASELYKLDMSGIYNTIKTCRMEFELISTGSKKTKKLRHDDLAGVFLNWKPDGKPKKIQWKFYGNSLKASDKSTGKQLKSNRDSN